MTRYWVGYLLTSEQTSTQAQLLFAHALADQDLLDADGLAPAPEDDGLPVLIAWSDNGPEMTGTDTRKFMALMSITQHHGRPGTPPDQAHIESFFSHLRRRMAAADRDQRPCGPQRRARPDPDGVQHGPLARRHRLCDAR